MSINQGSLKIVADAAWCGVSGTGRYATEFMDRFSNDPRFELTRIERRNPSSVHSPLALAIKPKALRESIFWSPQYMAPLFGYRKTVVTVHDILQVRYGSFAKRKYFDWILKNIYRRSSVTIATVSNFSKNEILEWSGLPAEKVVVSYNGVSDSFLKYDPAQIRESYFPFPYMLYVGNRRSHKNIPRMIEAFAASGIPDEVKLVLSGDSDSYIGEVARRVGIESRIYFAGQIEEASLPRLYGSAIAALYVSLYEGFGLPVVEAMAVGTPIISSNTTAIPEVAGDAAFLVDPTSVDEISSAISIIYSSSSKRDELVSRGIERAKLFSWDSSFDKLWNEVISQV